MLTQHLIRMRTKLTNRYHAVQYSSYVDRKQIFYYGLILTRQLLKLLRDMEIMTQLGCWDHWNVIDRDGWMDGCMVEWFQNMHVKMSSA